MAECKNAIEAFRKEEAEQKQRMADVEALEQSALTLILTLTLVLI